MSSAMLQIRVESKLKKNAEKTFEQMGLKYLKQLECFLQQSINDGALPFRPTIKQNLVNQTTINSFLESENGDFEDLSLNFKKSLKKNNENY